MPLNPEGQEESGDWKVCKEARFILKATVTDERCEIQLHLSSERRDVGQPHPQRLEKGNGQLHQEKEMFDQHEAKKPNAHTN